MTVSIALTKGRLEKNTVELLSSCAYGISPLVHKGRELIFYDTKKDIRYFLVKAHDCLTYVNHGVADIGIVGKDTIMEYGGSFYEMLDLNCGICRFVLAGTKDHNPLQMTGHIRIGSKYPAVTKAYFALLGKDVEIIRIEGSVELSPLVGLTDGIVDIMETGTTLKENGLVVYDEVAPVSARAIVNPASYKLKNKEVRAVLHDLEKAVNKSC